INGKRKYLLPGLYDMHAHGDDIDAIPEGVSPEELYSLYFANGITGVYDPWGFDNIFKWRRNIERGKVVGPRLHFSSPGVNDNTHSSADAVEESVRKWALQGYTAIKTHSPISRDKFERLHAVARELGLPVIGHALRPGFPIQATLDQGQSMLAHIEEILSVSVPFSQPQNFRDDLEEPLADVANSRIWVTTTVGTYDIIVKTVGKESFEQLFARPEMRYMPPSVQELWRNQNIYLQSDFLQDPAFWDRLLEIKLYSAQELRNLGALDRLLLGTDSGVPLLIPGFGIHDELRLLVRAGLTPWEALLTGTYNPAVFLDEIDERGTVAVGKRTNLLLVEKNPLRNTKNLKKVGGVLVDGTWLSKADLESRLEAIAARWE
ncbi:MAG: amidohydrolase family protein, partial [Thermoanaerobaculia bacterium]